MLLGRSRPRSARFDRESKDLADPVQRDQGALSGDQRARDCRRRPEEVAEKCLKGQPCPDRHALRHDLTATSPEQDQGGACADQPHQGAGVARCRRGSTLRLDGTIHHDAGPARGEEIRQVGLDRVRARHQLLHGAALDGVGFLHAARGSAQDTGASVRC